MIRVNYQKTEFANNTKVNAGDPVYKLVTDESWTLVTEISKETYDVLKKKIGKSPFFKR